MALGDGRVGTETREFELKVGQTIVYSKFGIGVTDVQLKGDMYCLLREEDVIGVLPRSGATAADVPELQPVGDRVLIKVLPSVLRFSRALLWMLPSLEHPCSSPHALPRSGRPNGCRACVHACVRA